MRRSKRGWPSKAAVVAFVSAFALGSPLAAAEVVQKGDLIISTAAKMHPQVLPRKGTAPVSVSVSGQISTTDEAEAPPLKQLQIEINRHGKINSQGLPICKIGQIQPASDERALANCRSALVGEGHFSGTISLPGSAPFPTEGRLLVFNGQEHGRQVLFGHVYAPHPFATSFVIVFQITAKKSGTYGTTLTANLAEALGAKRSLTGIEMTLSRRYLSAGCPAPKGFPGATFPLARTTFSFVGGPKFASTLIRNCRARG